MDTSFLNGKTVLLTGGTGTFGRAFIKRALQVPEIKKIILFSRDELKQSEVQAAYPNEPRLRYFLGDIRNRERLTRAFSGVDIVVHAAALKQVPATEFNPTEAIATNIDGTQNIVEAAIDTGVQKAILVSSDKAVEPINLYGATKLCAERLFIAANALVGASGPSFSVMRYGNVIGSRGSFVELIERNRAKGVIGLTDARMTRFWIRIDQVMDVVLESLSLMKGGEIFVPKMKDMAVRDVIKLLAPECKVEEIGIRPGEKLHERLVTQYEAPRTKEIERMYVIRPEFVMRQGAMDWLDSKPSVKAPFDLSSDNQDLLLSKEEATTLFARG
jgi:UDP-N-acetylglucosamine 4,6-dehydratase/5-epimerase